MSNHFHKNIYINYRLIDKHNIKKYLEGNNYIFNKYFKNKKLSNNINKNIPYKNNIIEFKGKKKIKIIMKIEIKNFPIKTIIILITIKIKKIKITIMEIVIMGKIIIMEIVLKHY